jgi:hypothetical protein
MDGSVTQRLIWLGLAAVLLTTGCRRVVLSLEKVPQNTPKGAQIYVAGSFNNWNPGDPAYQMKYDELSKQYTVDLPMGFGAIEYKFTRGDWTTTETDPCGGELPNRKIRYSDQELVSDSIAGWADLEPENCARLTLIIDRIPSNTPVNDDIFLGGNVNGWQCNNRSYKFTRMPDGRFMLTLPRVADKVEFKITRGSWETAELNETGDEQLQREIVFGKKDTVHLAINAWMDKPLLRVLTHTIVIRSMPANTPRNSEFYLTGNFNNWNPIDRNYLFTSLPNGTKIISVKYSGVEPFMYKITRGGWQKVEYDQVFSDMPNRVATGRESDTIRVDIAAWADLTPGATRRITTSEHFDPAGNSAHMRAVAPPAQLNLQPVDYDKSKKVFIIIDKLPEMEKDDQVYLAGDFNGWNAGDPNYIFRNLPNGKKYFLLRMSDYGAHEFKVTRGSWSSEEVAYNMEKIRNRVIAQGMDNDTLHIRVENWIDFTPRKKLVMVLSIIPENTPDADDIYLTGDFNDWETRDEKYRFSRLPDGKRVLNINNFSRKFGAYKITRGSWPTEAVNKRGWIPDNQQFDNIRNDTIRLRIERWRDLK